jgi:hypothetical protein
MRVANNNIRNATPDLLSSTNVNVRSQIASLTLNFKPIIGGVSDADFAEVS